ncbi:MAG: hypothetical protein QW328_07210 [Nitrososphaerota archaeon]
MSSELKCPLCNCQFSTIDDLAAHLTTHKTEVTESSPQNEVAITEIRGWRV